MDMDKLAFYKRFKDHLVEMLESRNGNGYIRRKKVGQLTRSQEVIREYFEKLNADLAIARNFNKNVSINISYEDKGEFIYMDVENGLYYLKFIRHPQRIDVWGKKIVYKRIEDRYYHEDYKVDVIKTSCDEHRLNFILYKAFEGILEYMRYA